MRTLSMSAATLSLILAATSVAAADDAKPDAKPAAPVLSDVLASSGLTATGYVDGTYSYTSLKPPGSSSTDTNTFALNQASLTLGYTPASGFGALVDAVIGTEACDGCYAPGYAGAGTPASTSSTNLLQGYLQYVSGKTTIYGGKFVTLAGAEVAAPTGNTNVTRSLLFWYSEPVTHVGVRVAYAASDAASFTGGINNGWNIDGSTAKGGKTLEVGTTLIPSKAFTLAAAGYYGDFNQASNGIVGKRALIDLVATWTATSAVTVIVNADWDQQQNADASGHGSASWYGVAGYLNCALSDTWRTSVRLEYLDDKDGYNFGGKTDVDEGTLTFGYMPAKNFELRLEGRYDTYKPSGAGSSDATQAWVQALFKF
jgi:hypothetical protein